MNSCEAPTLELPWSDTPVYIGAYPAAAYPGANTYLPCTYPGAEAPALPRLPGRLPRRTWPFFPSSSSSSLPAALHPPPPRARPKAPGSPKNPPPPAYPGARPGPWPGPSRGLRTGGRPGRPGLGSRSNSHFPQKEFVWETGQIDSRLSGRGSAYPGATLEPAGEDETPEANPDERQRPATGRDAYPGAGDRPTLHLHAEGRSKTNQPNQTHQRTPTRPPEGGCVGEIEAKYGLPSADRNNKATLLLTGPFRTAKSSAKDLTPLVLKLQYAKYRGPLRGPRRNRLLRH